MADDPLVETWRIHDRIHRYLIDALDDAALQARVGDKGRTVADQLAHVHNVRLLWLKSADAALAEGLPKFERGEVGRAELRAALETSGERVAALVARCLADGTRPKGFKPHTAAFVGYLISHESHHRGQVAMTLRQAGHPLPKSVAFGLWEWGSR